MRLRRLGWLLFFCACRHHGHATNETSDAAACTPTTTISVRRPSLDGTRREAYALARALASDQGPELAAALRPDSEDYAAVFDQPLAQRMEQWAARWWDALDAAHAVMLNDIQLARAPDQAPLEVDLYALTPSMLESPGSELCGAAYTKSGIQHHIAKGTTVYCFSFHAIDHVAASKNIADALVFVRGHWAFFPHPNEVPKTFYAAKCAPRVVTDNAPIAIATPRAPSDPSGPDAARAMLEHWIADRADAPAELAKLEPTLADVRAVYREPAASQLFAAMKPKWAAVRRGGDYTDSIGGHVLPQPDDEVVHLAASTPDTIGGEDSECPVGYRDVVRDLLPNTRIYCFTFSRIGLSGSSMDGLVFVHGRWVLIPRPWELLGR